MKTKRIRIKIVIPSPSGQRRNYYINLDQRNYLFKRFKRRLGGKKVYLKLKDNQNPFLAIKKISKK